MAGKVSFHFDDGFRSVYEQCFPVFAEAGAVGCVAMPARGSHLSHAELLEMQKAGWEILSHSMMHVSMREPMSEKDAWNEIVESKRVLEEAGFKIRQFVTPMSQCHESMIPLLKEHYDAAFTVYTNSLTEPIEKLVIERPVNPHKLHRCCTSGKTIDELKAYVDYVAENNAWLVFYDHDLAVKGNITRTTLRALLEYCNEKGVAVVTSSTALEDEK